MSELPEFLRARWGRQAEPLVAVEVGGSSVQTATLVDGTVVFGGGLVRSHPGVVFRLGGGKIAKVWFHAGTAELRWLADFYASVETPSIRTPEILEVHDRTPYRVTVEAELPGVPLYTVAPEFGTPARDCALDVLGELAAVTTTPTLAVLDDVKPFALWSPRIREIEAAFDQATVGRFGYDPEVLRIYRAVHLLLIANAHDADPYERDDAVGLAAALLN